MEWGFSITSTPILSKTRKGCCKCSAFALISSIFPWVIAAAIAYEPASILSATTVDVAPCSFSTPSIVKIDVFLPSMRAPILFNKSIRLAISGSFAAFSILVIPLAKVAAIKILQVAPTDALWKITCAPCSPFGAFAITYPFLISISAPICSKDERWMSIGRAPIAHPPGKESSACLKRESNGPKT